MIAEAGRRPGARLADGNPGRASYRAVTDAEAMNAFSVLCRTEGIIPAIESAHALARALDVGRQIGPGGLIGVNLSGRGDKDVNTACRDFVYAASLMGISGTRDEVSGDAADLG